MSALRIKKNADRMEESTPKEEPSPLVMTIGHSTRTLEEFIRLLQTHGATCVVDVRTVPRLSLIHISSDLTPQVARRAYELYEQRGRRDGQAGQDWLEAEREIRKDEAHK